MHVSVSSGQSDGALHAAARLPGRAPGSYRLRDLLG
jgi:hypothetical protein